MDAECGSGQFFSVDVRAQYVEASRRVGDNLTCERVHTGDCRSRSITPGDEGGKVPRRRIRIRIGEVELEDVVKHCSFLRDRRCHQAGGLTCAAALVLAAVNVALMGAVSDPAANPLCISDEPATVELPLAGLTTWAAAVCGVPHLGAAA
jgi:hypothetical protein